MVVISYQGHLKAKVNPETNCKCLDFFHDADYWWIYIQNLPPHTPIRDPILSFSHTFSPKSARIGGQCPPQNGSMPTPPREILDPPLQIVTLRLRRILVHSGTLVQKSKALKALLTSCDNGEWAM